MYDLAVIGGGWAGFKALLRAKELGLKTVLIERADLGGTCLNRGCIPTKSLLQSAKIYTLCAKASVFGIDLPAAATINLKRIQERKGQVVSKLSAQIQAQLKGLEVISGQAEIVSPQEIEVSGKIIGAGHILIASGSVPVELPGLKFDGKKIVSSDMILELDYLPASILIVGGGVIGCEFATLYSCLGSQVTVVEKLPQLLPEMDAAIARKLAAFFKKKGINVLVGTDVFTLDLEKFELVLVCVGRRPYSENLAKAQVGLKIEKGRVVTDDYLRTSLPNIYAAGDCTGKLMLAHYAAYQGILAVENIVNAANPVKEDSRLVPNCIFTLPEVASIGINEQAAQSRGQEFEVHLFDFFGSGMAQVLDEAEGFIKILSDKLSKEIIGVSIIGPRATELIAVFSLALSRHLTIYQLKSVIFAHPTLAESVSEGITALIPY